MKKKFIILALILSSILLLSGCSTSRPEKIGLLNMDRVLQKSEKAQKSQKELQDIGNNLEEKYQQKKEELSGDKEDQELDKIYQEYEDNKQRLEDGLNQQIEGIIKEIADQEGLNIVLYSDTVYYGGQDITDQVIQKLDEGGETDSE